MNGETRLCRSLGNFSQFPAVSPLPSLRRETLSAADEFLILANAELWRFLAHQEAVKAIRQMDNPILAAKRLQDLAQVSTGGGWEERWSGLFSFYFFDKPPGQVRSPFRIVALSSPDMMSLRCCLNRQFVISQ